jgi:hypothetical protein
MKPALLVFCGAIAMAALTLAIVTIAALVPVFAATGMAG